MTPTSLEELLLCSGAAALQLSGAAQSAWNGQVVDARDGVLGLAHWDGTLHLDRETILDPLREMYALAGKHHPPTLLAHYREALATLLHEHSHFLGPPGATQEAARIAFTRPGSRQLEEGIAEAWSQDHLTAYLTSLGIHKVAPGIENLRTVGYYPAYVTAARLLTTDLDTRNNLTPGTTLHTLNNQTAEHQLPALVTLYYLSTPLPTLEPTGAPTREHLESLLRTTLPALDAQTLLPHPQATTQARQLTHSLLTRLHTDLTRATTFYKAFAGLPTPNPNHPTTPTSAGTRSRKLTHPAPQLQRGS
ncbi:hypothetical protein HPO96_16075 [Kribbella sandramycini]|uniref:Uncharacterized protein n=1 Tax=Kribbella sandramycini TaxID=60450 RepID=A0A7Y4NZN0_9ACTN|nr:hypothetical protein [Kribbella sandramycini]MBB6565499.1 hypothetical protein [Kribbella sandramycini]NOL41766.1 hypothetical protein [Kribbella sandramycini]